MRNVPSAVEGRRLLRGVRHMTTDETSRAEPSLVPSLQTQSLT
jgi:hypothetical protein